MKKLDIWLEEYSVSHKNPTNKKIHNICVPLIMLSIIGMLWVLPIPKALQINPIVNWGSIFISLCLIFYFSLGNVIGVFMMCVSIALLSICHLVDQYTGLSLLHSSIVVFILSWIGQFIGHNIEGKKPSFLKDLQFLLIGPLWVFHPWYSKFLR